MCPDLEKQMHKGKKETNEHSQKNQTVIYREPTGGFHRGGGGETGEVDKGD